MKLKLFATLQSKTSRSQLKLDAHLTRQIKLDLHGQMLILTHILYPDPAFLSYWLMQIRPDNSTSDVDSH